MKTLLDETEAWVSESIKETEKFPEAVKNILHETESSSFEQNAGNLCEWILPTTQERFDEQVTLPSKIMTASNEAPTAILVGNKEVILGNMLFGELLELMTVGMECPIVTLLRISGMIEIDKLLEKKSCPSVENKREKFPSL